MSLTIHQDHLRFRKIVRGKMQQHLRNISLLRVHWPQGQEPGEQLEPPDIQRKATSIITLAGERHPGIRRVAVLRDLGSRWTAPRARRRREAPRLPRQS
jgi:hypothetical protein